MKDSKPQAARAPKGGLNAEIQARIGHQLRAMYDDVVRQGVPDRFAELIRRLDAPGVPTGTDAASPAAGEVSADDKDGRD
jgi:hypothetical protein